jgi:glutathione S-transferase
MLVWGNVDFEDRRYEVGPAPHYDKSEWIDAKEHLGLAFPNLPFLIDRANGIAITQHQSILRYLAQRLGLEGQGSAGAAMADMATEASREWLDAFCSLTYSSYLIYIQRKGQYLAETLPHHANRFETILLGQERAAEGGTTVPAFLCGVGESSLTYADFFLFEVLEQHRLWNPLCLQKFPARMIHQTAFLH